MAGEDARVYARSLSDPEGVRGEAAEALHWDRRRDRVRDDGRPRPSHRSGGGLSEGAAHPCRVDLAQGSTAPVSLD